MNNCKNECASGVVFTEAGDLEYCDCKSGDKARFMHWFSQEKKSLANKMRVV